MGHWAAVVYLSAGEGAGTPPMSRSEMVHRINSTHSRERNLPVQSKQLLIKGWRAFYSPQYSTEFLSSGPTKPPITSFKKELT